MKASEKSVEEYSDRQEENDGGQSYEKVRFGHGDFMAKKCVLLRNRADHLKLENDASWKIFQFLFFPFSTPCKISQEENFLA